jgi:endo-1,4-beta-D-glucanase Y
MFGGADCLNASYFAPGYYRAFAGRPGASTTDAQRWTRLADDTYELIDRMAHPATGLVPNWADMQGNSYEGGPSGCPWYSEPHIYGADAIRTPWRISTDYVWWGTTRAKPWLDKVTDWVKSIGITEVLRRYNLDGTPSIPPEPGRQENSILAVGAFAAGAMAYDQPTANEFAAHAAALQEQPRYYVDSLRALYFLQLSGRFTTCGGT